MELRSYGGEASAQLKALAASDDHGLGDLREGQKLAYEVQTDPRKRKTSAVNLRAL